MDLEFSSKPGGKIEGRGEVGGSEYQLRRLV
jgi:hypothetical protein